MTSYSVLLGIGDTEQARACESLLFEHGVRCESVSTGPSVIERALFERYQAIVLDPTLGLLEPKKVRDLLRTNPRTRGVAVYLIDTTGAAAEDAEYLQDPLEDLNWLATALPSLADSNQDGVVSADLREIQLPDMLQMLLQNNRTGIAEVESSGKLARIEIADGGFGKIQLEAHDGLKALARILNWEVGEFRFHPKAEVSEQAVGDPMGLLLDAVRLSDEAAEARRNIPPGSRLVYADNQGDTPGDHLLDEVLMLVDFYGAVDDILERVPVPDAEILAAILRLRDDGWVDVHTPEQGATDTATEWPDIDLATPAVDGFYPTVWITGCDADFVRVLWNDARLQARCFNRKSLRNGGRFGGNGWIVDVGRERKVWLRFMSPGPFMKSFCLRNDLGVVGAIAVVAEQDRDEHQDDWIDGLEIDAGIRTAWLVLGKPDGAWMAQQLGRRAHVFVAKDDTPWGFWQALDAVLSQDQ